MEEIRINKYLLYWIVMGITFCLTILPRFWYAITFSKTSGVVRNFKYETRISGGKTIATWYPVVDFNVGNDRYSFYGSDAEENELNPGDGVDIIYSKQNPNKAFVYTFPGFWGPSLYFFIPVLVLFSAVLLTIGVVPKIIILKI